MARPQKKAKELAHGPSGLPRFAVEVPDDLLDDINAEAALDERTRLAETRVLLTEAIAARKAARNQRVTKK